MIIEM